MDNQNNPGFLSRLRTWATYPLTNQMDMLSVVLTTLLVVSLAYAWIIVMRHITED